MKQKKETFPKSQNWLPLFVIKNITGSFNKSVLNFKFNTL